MARVKPIPMEMPRLGGPKGYPYRPRPRCPSCDNWESVQYKAALVDETGTFAIKPQEVAEDPRMAMRKYRYQEYRYLQCDHCWFTWFTEPTGRWSTKPSRLTSEPDDPRPARLIDETSGARSDLGQDHRFSNICLTPGITTSPVILLTGAGASVPFGFGAARGYRFPEAERLTLDRIILRNLLRTGSVGEYIGQAPGRQLLVLAEHYPKDMEILLDVLLRLQQSILHEGGDTEVVKALNENGFPCSSWYVFDETGGLRHAYPPLTRALANAAFRGPIESSEYFKDVRKLLESVCMAIMTTYGPPDAVGLQNAREILKPLFDHLRALIPTPLPIFTTNFDQVIEVTLAPEGEKLYDGFAPEESGTISVHDTVSSVTVPFYEYHPQILNEAKKDDVCLFHMHGASNYFVDATSGALFLTASKRHELLALQKYAWEVPGKLLLGAIVPATCKDRYLYAEPFALAYDHFYESLRHSRVCVIIGQSGRDYVIRRALYSAAEINEHLRFLVIDRERVPAHLSDVLPADRVDFYGDGLSVRSVEWIVKHTQNLLSNM